MHGLSWQPLSARRLKMGPLWKKTLTDIIAVIISPHHRSYTGLCFPNAWDPMRPLILENNDEVRLKSLYDLPNNCPCDYEIPMLKHLPKAKKGKTADNKNTKNRNKDKDANKTKT